MATPQAPSVERIVRTNVSWTEFERLLDESGENPSRLSYCDGVLEAVVLSGSITIKRADIKKGVEPDSCHYIQSAPVVRNVQEFNFEVHPPPDLVIEVDITNNSRIKFPLFSALGIPEVWRYDGEDVAIHVLRGDKYE